MPRDAMQERVALQIYSMVADAYGYVPDHLRPFEPPCSSCGGDGCGACRWTGEAKAA